MTPGPDPASARALAPRFAALHIPDYRWFFVANLLAMTGDSIEHVISYWVIFQTFHSPTLAGFAVISHWLPFLLFSVYTGALADRYDCRSLIQTGQALFMAASVAWGVLFLTDSLETWHAVVILLIHGAAGVVGGPAAQLILHDMVGAAQLQSAIRLNASSRNLSILLGPAVGGGLMLLLGPAWGLLANVLFYVPLTVLLLRLPYTGHAAGAQAPRARFSLGDALRVLGEIRAERRIVHDDPAGRRHLVPGGQRLPGPDAGVRAPSRRRRSGRSVQRPARRQRGRRRAGRDRPREHGHPAPAARGRRSSAPAAGA